MVTLSGVRKDELKKGAIIRKGPRTCLLRLRLINAPATDTDFDLDKSTSSKQTDRVTSEPRVAQSAENPGPSCPQLSD